jgi:hypothetical protein
MANLNAIRAGLKARLATITGVRTYAVEPAKPEPPALWVYGPLPQSTYDMTFDGLMHWYFDVKVATNPADIGRSQTSIDTYLDATGSNSIKAAIEADVTLGGSAHYARVIGMGEAPHLDALYGSALLVASVRLEVVAAP